MSLLVRRGLVVPHLALRGLIVESLTRGLEPLTRGLATMAPLAARRWEGKATPAYTSRFSNPVREAAGMKAPPPEKTDYMYDIKPHKLKVVKYGRYTWCGCGLARTEQPLCDKTCMNLNMAKLVKAGPVEYVAPQDGEVWFCNCKQTNNRPFCDGSHRTEEVQNHRFDHRPQFWEPRASKKKSVVEE